MHAYKFRIQFEENEDFCMDVELKASQTFLDFHNAIKNFCQITTNELASFFISDDSWRKKKEIMLFDMNEGQYDDEELKAKKPMIMETSVLNKVIINPHQRFLYVYDFIKMHTFSIELIQIKEASSAIEYPALIKKEGEVKLTKPSNDLLGLLDDDEAFPEDLSDNRELLYGDEPDPEELNDLSADIFSEDPDKF